MGEVYTSGKRGGKPKQIDGFTGSMQIITETTTWTCPATGEYYISCIGQGGINFAGDEQSNTTRTTLFFVYGGGGGIAESKLKLQKGNEITITIDAGVSSFGSYLSATGGGNVKVKEDEYGNCSKITAGSGGSGSGGNVGNFDGDNGKKEDTRIYLGNRNDYVNKQGGGTNKSAKYGGATGGSISYYGTLNFTYPFYSVCPTPANLGIYPYGSSQGNGCYFYDDIPSYGKDLYIKNGAVIIEYMG